DEPPGLVRHVPFVEVATDQRHMRTVVDVRRGGGERRLRLLGLLDEREHALALVQLDDPVLPRELATADVVDGDGARLPPAVPPADEVREARVEEVVAADHEQVLVLEPCAIDDELDVADRAGPGLLALWSVVLA